MKRVGGLRPKLVSMPHLIESAKKAAAGKRSRPDVTRSILNLERELVALQRGAVES